MYEEDEPTRVDNLEETVARCIECGTMSIEDSFSGDALGRARQLFITHRCIHGRNWYVCGEKQKLVYYFGSDAQDEIV